jgi:hypothetical protein
VGRQDHRLAGVAHLQDRLAEEDDVDRVEARELSGADPVWRTAAELDLLWLPDSVAPLGELRDAEAVASRAAVGQSRRPMRLAKDELLEDVIFG